MAQWEDAPESKWEDAPDEGFLKKAYGAAEGVASSASHIFAGVPMGLRALGEWARTGSLDEGLDNAQSSADAASFEPSTKTGKAVSESINKTMQDYQEEVGSKFAGSLSESNKRKLSNGTLTAADLRGENTEHMVGDVVGGVYVPGMGGNPLRGGEKVKPVTDVDKVLAKQAEIDAAKKAAMEPKWEDAPGTQAVVDDPFSQMKRQLNTPQTNEGPFIDPAQLREQQAPINAFDQMGKQLEDQPNVEAQRVDDARQSDAQQAIDQRTAAQDLDVKRQATLDFNAAERARQENAPIPERIPEATAADPLLGELYGELQDRVVRDTPDTRAPTPFPEPNSRFPNNKQRGAINPAVFEEGFQKLKQLADGTWLRAYSDGRGLSIEATKDSRVIGHADFDKPRNLTDDLSANFTASDKKGLGKEMYQFVAELGNDVKRSNVQTEAGKAMWNSFERNGVSQDGRIKSPGNKQMGAIRLGEKKQQQVEKIMGKDKSFIPADPDPTQIVAEALTEGKDNKQWNYTESGSTLAAMKRGSTAVLGASRLIQNAVKRADLAIRKNVFPVEDSIRQLSTKDVKTFAELLIKEGLRGERWDAEALDGLTSVKTQVAYAHFRAMMEESLRIQNEARAADGKAPITALEAYTSHRWQGDFRRPVFQTVLDKAGNPKIKADGSLERKLVWYLAADTKMGLERQWKALSKEHPDLAYDPKEDHTVRYYKRQTDLQSAYTTMLDIIGRDDPAVEKLKAAVEAQTANEAASLLNQEKHFKEQTGVRGFVGDRPDTTGRVGRALGRDNKSSEALAFLQQQINYAKNAHKWSEIQTAGQGIKQIISDPKLIEQQPNNVKYIREYYKNAVGYGESKVMSTVEDAVRDLGMSPAMIDAGIGNMKSYFILSKLGINLGYSAVSMLQSANVLPHLMDQWVSKRTAGNPVTAMSVGIAGGLAMASGHYVPFLRSMGASIADSNFYKQAFKYAEENGVSARSMYDEAPINSSFSATGKVGHAIGLTMTIPEVASRSIAYMSFVQALREGGKYHDLFDTKGNHDWIPLFQKAEELTNTAMVDYRAQERPMVFPKMGIAGTALGTLQTYPMNWYNQFNYFARESAKGNVAPIVSFLALQYAIAGAMGIPGFDDADKLYGFIRDHLPAKYYAQVKDSAFWSEPKLWMLEHFGDAAVYGALSDKTGIGFTSRVTAPGGGQMIQAPGGPIIDAGKQIINLADAATSVNDKTKWAQSAMSSIPTGQQGRLEQAPFMEGSTYEKMQNGNRLYQRPGDLADHKGVYERDAYDERLRGLGLRSQKEVVNREVGYRTDHANQVAGEKAKSIPDAFYDALKQGNKDKATDLYNAYTKLTGKPISDETIQKQIMDNYTTAIQRSGMAATTVTQMQNVARMQKLLETIKREQTQ